MKNINRVIILLALLLMSCADDNTPEAKPATGLLADNVINSNGMDREYHLFVPENYTNKPVVILLHGNGGSHDDIIGSTNIKSPHKVWLSIAENNDIIVVVPNGTLGDGDKRGWNDCRADAMGNPTADDVMFIADLLNSIKNEYDYDEDRVYVAGTSNGGHMAYRLAQELPGRITAFASIVSSIAGNSECADSSLPVSALFMNGTEDPILPYNGGEMVSNRGLVLSSQQSVNYWTTRNGTTAVPVTENIPDNNTTDDSSATKYLYQNGTNNTEVALYEIVNGGHTEPSIQERYSSLYLLLVGNQNGDFEMAEEIWNFFKNKSK